MAKSNSAMDPFQVEIDKLNQGEKFKLEGNNAFSAKDFRIAIGKYHRGLLCLKGVGHSRPSYAEQMYPTPDNTIPEHILKKRDILTSECYNNLAACLLKSSNPKYEKIVDYCEHALKLDPGNVKAIFRMGTALRKLDHLERAKTVLTSHEKCATEKDIQHLLVQIEDDERNRERNLQLAYKKMFAPKHSAPLKKTDGAKQPAENATCEQQNTRELASSESQHEDFSVADELNSSKTSFKQSPVTVGTKIIQVASIKPFSEEDSADGLER